MVTIIWDTQINEGFEKQGLEITRRIWNDMKDFDGYITHEILVDDDDQNHIVILSNWTTREAADMTVKAYAKSEPVKLLAPLLAGPRKRNVYYAEH